MNKFFIAIGGTGQMAALAYLRLAKLVGFEPADIYVMDRDLEGPITTKLNEVMGKKEQDAIPTISPIPNEKGLEYFKNVFGDLASPKIRNVLSVLFTQDQLNTHIEKGMYAKPPVGAATFMEKIRRVKQKPESDKWLRQLMSLINQAGGDNKVVISGSVMGGTGAGGVPTLAKYIRRTVQGQLQLTIVDFLKWFILTQSNSDMLLEKNAQSGIYYLGDEIARDVDACVLLGLDHTKQIDYKSVGEQEEIPHFINLLAAIVTNNAFHTKQYDVMFPSKNELYAYVLPDGGFCDDPENAYKAPEIFLPDGGSVKLTEVIKMVNAVTEFLKILAGRLQEGETLSFWKNADLPGELVSALERLAEVNSEDKTTTWEKVAGVIEARRKEITGWLDWLETLWVPNYCDFPINYTVLTSSKYNRDLKKPIIFLREWMSTLELTDWKEDATIERLVDELVLALRKSINLRYLNSGFGDMAWLERRAQ